MSDEWDGRERRKDWSEVVVHVAEIRKDISYIKSGLDEHRVALSKHFQEDDLRFSALTDKLDGVRQIAWKVIGGVAVVMFILQYLPMIVKALNSKGG